MIEQLFLLKMTVHAGRIHWMVIDRYAVVSIDSELCLKAGMSRPLFIDIHLSNQMKIDNDIVL